MPFSQYSNSRLGRDTTSIKIKTPPSRNHQATLLESDGYLAIRNGKPQTAIQNVWALFNIADCYLEQPNILYQLVRISIIKSGLRLLESLLSQTRCSEMELTQFQQRIQRAVVVTVIESQDSLISRKSAPQTIHFETKLRLTETGLAVARFQSHLGALPMRLSDLAPRFIPDVASSPRDGLSMEMACDEGRVTLFFPDEDGEKYACFTLAIHAFGKLSCKVNDTRPFAHVHSQEIKHESFHAEMHLLTRDS